MFEKIRLIDGKIRFLRFSVTWQEESEQKHADCFTQEEADAIKEMLKPIELICEIIKTEIPPNLEEYDGISFDGIHNDAIEFINQTGKYDPRTIEIERLKAELTATDYQAIKYAEGLISEEQYLPIKQARQILRDKINMLQIEKKD